MRDDAVWKLADDEEGETISLALFLICSSFSSLFPESSLLGDRGAFLFDVLRPPEAEPDGDAGTETPPVMIDVNGVKTALFGFGCSAGIVDATFALL